MFPYLCSPQISFGEEPDPSEKLKELAEVFKELDGMEFGNAPDKFENMEQKMEAFEKKYGKRPFQWVDEEIESQKTNGYDAEALRDVSEELQKGTADLNAAMRYVSLAEWCMQNNDYELAEVFLDRCLLLKSEDIGCYKPKIEVFCS